MKFIWTIKCAYWLIHYGYESNLIDAYEYAKEEGWQSYRESGMTAKEAVEEDLSYA